MKGFQLTDQGLLAKLLGLTKVLLPLEESESFVDQGQNVHVSRPGRLLQLNGGVELLNGVREAVLVHEELAKVVVDLWDLFKVLDAATERRHRRSDRAHLVLRDTELDVREDKVTVQVDRLLVVLGGLGELALDEVQLRAVVVDVGVFGVLG